MIHMELIEESKIAQDSLCHQGLIFDTITRFSGGIIKIDCPDFYKKWLDIKHDRWMPTKEFKFDKRFGNKMYYGIFITQYLGDKKYRFEVDFVSEV